MWCICKSRNDYRFDRKQGAPCEVIIAARAITSYLELQDVAPSDQLHQNHALMQGNIIPAQGSTIKSNLLTAKAKVYADAAWKTTKLLERMVDQA